MSSVTPPPSRRSSLPPSRRPSLLAALSTVRSRRVAAPRTRLSAAERAQLEKLAAGAWRVVFMAPLWGLEMTDVRSLNATLHRLAQIVRLELDQTPETKGLQVECSVLDAVAERHAPIPCISMTVTKPSSSRPAAELVFLSENSVDQLLPPCCDGKYVWMPLVLARGSPVVRDLVLARLRASHSCTSVVAGFTQDEMRWMAAMWSGGDGSDRESAGSVTLEYSTPETTAAAGLRTTSLQLPASQIRLIWGHVHDSSQAEMTRESMDKFHQVMARVMHNSMGLPLGAFDLVRLDTPVATVLAEGKIKFASAEAVDRCLGFLRQLAKEFFDM